MSNNWTKETDPSKPVVVSTGPTTPEGKAISSQNALKHGSCADTLILKHENQSDYDQVRAIWFRTYEPKEEGELCLVQELIDAHWLLQRATRNVNHIEGQLLEQEPNPLNWTEQQQRTLGRFLRYQTARANAVNRARKAVEDFRKARMAEKGVAQKQKIKTDRHDQYLKKAKREQTWDEWIEEAQQKLEAQGKPRVKLSDFPLAR